MILLLVCPRRIDLNRQVAMVLLSADNFEYLQGRYTTGAAWHIAVKLTDANLKFWAEVPLETP